ncbi:transketolase [Jeotgalibaca ciconiae]|uniref:Transketolase n=1 Tax=Jeotgalibaca ciconiae TaxID=2496265 RepID=A0A3Q9BKG1_9LACT|nr:transketolase [Jeotgalibaca ciconiae]AZP04515.1 transketolase [Jeotgalibaca ciconiae]
MFDQIDALAVNTVRTLSIDAVQKANSGHPGLPMGAAPMAYSLWTKFLKVNPKNSSWADRDRFVLSAGHGSALLYSLLHLSGYDVSIDDLKNFRQYESKTPGHPEVHYTDGVEATTGPLGQGIANSVGMAMAEAHLAATYNKDSFPIVDHFTYFLCGDGDLMEGISHEAASLAGHLKLGKLIGLYDSNDISLDGPTSKAFTEDVAKRFEAYGWQHILVKDGNDLEEISRAIEEAKAETDKPTLIEIKTVIGFGASNAGTHKVHGAPLGDEGVTFAKKSYAWEFDNFHVPEEVQTRFNEAITEKGQKSEEEWNELFAAYKEEYPELAQQFEDAFAGKLPEGWEEKLPVYEVGDADKATRVTSSEAIQALGEAIPYFWGGSADLSSSNNTMNQADSDFSADNYAGRNIWYGVREFAMGAMMNGILLHGGSKTYAGTFFVFTDYLRPAMRLAALSQLGATYVMTHDSVAVGEDGPTHEPVEHISSFRGMPNMNLIRPADGNEVSAAWAIAMESHSTPTLLVLTRQGLPVLEGTKENAKEGVSKGGYVLSPQEGEKPDGILIATGSEVSLAINAQAALRDEGVDVSVVSMPSTFLFEKQDVAYKETVLPNDVRNRMSIEMGATLGWERYVGLDGLAYGIDRWGASGEGNTVTSELGFTPEKVVNAYLDKFK